MAGADFRVKVGEYLIEAFLLVEVGEVDVVLLGILFLIQKSILLIGGSL